MPYITQIPDATIDLSTGTPVLTLGNTLLLNELYTSQEFELYDVGGPGARTLNAGDNLSTVDANGNEVVGGQYAGAATLSTAAAGLNVGLLGATVQVNSISGSLMVDDSGNAYFITDEPLDEDRLNVTLNVTSLGTTLLDTTVPISELADTLTGALSPLLSPVQQALDTVVVSVGTNGTAPLELDETEVTCFVAGTLIETRSGPVAVEDLKVGDEVLTRDNGYQPIRWIGSTRLSARMLALFPRLCPIRISAGALGQDMPAADLLVSPQHRVLVRSRIALKMFGAMEVLVPAKQLLQIDGIDQATDLQTVEYFHFLLDRHEVVISNGAETESLYTGPQALKSVSKEAHAEILALFPELASPEYRSDPARQIPSGRRARKLAHRHMQAGRELLS